MTISIFALKELNGKILLCTGAFLFLSRILKELFMCVTPLLGQYFVPLHYENITGLLHYNTAHYNTDFNIYNTVKSWLPNDNFPIVLMKITSLLGLGKNTGTPVYRSTSLAWYVPLHTCLYRGILVFLFIVTKKKLKSPKY